jgi:hypothetical protein
VTAAWYVVPAIYLWQTVQKYLSSGGSTYQESVVRTDWSPQSLASDWWFNIASSLDFWTWQREENIAGSIATVLSILAALTFIAGGLLLMRIVREEVAPAARAYWILLGAGTALLALSFPAYLLLNSARSLWRTQFLSGIGNGIVWAAILALVSMAMWKKTVPATVLMLGAVIVYFGAGSAIAKGRFHRGVWDRHRAAIVRILHTVPSVKPGTVIVLAGVPKNDDPFGDNMWFDFGMRLSYPGIPVSGKYFYADGTPSPGNKVDAPGANTIVIDWNGRLIEDAAHAIAGPMSPIAIHRYHP